MKKVYQIFLFSFLGFYFLFNSNVMAADGLKVGDAEVIPWGEIKLQYDDNIFLDPNNEKDDFITVLTPGVSVDCPFGDNRLTLDYHVDFIEYLDNSSQNAKNHYLSSEANINWQDIAFTLYEKFERVFERPSTEDTSRVKRDDNTTGIKAKLQKERLGIQIGYEHFIRNYRSEPQYEPYDRKEHLYSFVLTHKTFPKTELLLEYDFAQIRYDDESSRSDSDYNQLLVGAIGEITPRTTATIKTGYQWRSYDSSTESDFNAAVLYADMIHKFSEKDALKLSFLRSANESTYDVNNYYKIENVSAVFDHFFNNKLMGFLNGEYQINSYPRETTEGTEVKKREDNYYSLGAGLRYYIRKWLTLTLECDHIIRDSNFSVFEYHQNLVTFSAKAIF